MFFPHVILMSRLRERPAMDKKFNSATEVPGLTETFFRNMENPEKEIRNFKT